MLTDAKKIHIIEEVLKMNDDKTLSEIEAVIEKSQKAKNTKVAKSTYSNHWDDPAFVAEMDRRYNDMVSGKDKGYTLEEVIARGRKAVKEVEKEMSYKLNVSNKADQEFTDALVWYAAQQESLDKRFEKAVVSLLISIKDNPELYHFTKGKYREASVPGFPYVIVYKALKSAQIISVVSIHNTQRQPSKKYKQ